MLRAAIQYPDPVIFLEPKKLYWSKGEVDTEVVATIGKAEIVRAGTDVTLFAYGASVPLAITAAEVAAEPRAAACRSSTSARSPRSTMRRSWPPSGRQVAPS